VAETLKVGFIGIGNMGRPMAANLARAGVPLTVFDADPGQSARFAAEHDCTVAASLAGLGGAVDVVVTMLPTGAIVREVLLEAEAGALADALANSSRNGAIVVDMSSSEPVGTRALGAALAGRGVTLVDAPVSGGIEGAKAATLAIMIGADDEAAVKRVEPLLAAMGKRLFRTGPLGSGHAMKALNNFVAAAGFAAAAEALIVGERFGLDPAVMVDIINSSSGRNFNTENSVKDHVVTRSFAAGFKLALMTKDVKIAAELGDDLKLAAPLSHVVHDHLAEALAALGAEADFTLAVTHWERTGQATKKAAGGVD